MTDLPEMTWQNPKPTTWMEYRISTEPTEDRWNLTVPLWYDTEAEWLDGIEKARRETPHITIRVMRSFCSVHTEEALLP